MKRHGAQVWDHKEMTGSFGNVLSVVSLLSANEIKEVLKKFPFFSMISLLSHPFGIHYMLAPGASSLVLRPAVIWFIEIIWQGNRP